MDTPYYIESKYNRIIYSTYYCLCSSTEVRKGVFRQPIENTLRLQINTGNGGHFSSFILLTVVMLGLLDKKRFIQLETKAELEMIQPDEIQELINYIICLEAAMDACDQEDFFGTEGWRHRFGLED